MNLEMTAWSWTVLRSMKTRPGRLLAWIQLWQSLIAEQAAAKRKATLAELLVASGAIS